MAPGSRSDLENKNKMKSKMKRYQEHLVKCTPNKLTANSSLQSTSSMIVSGPGSIFTVTQEKMTIMLMHKVHIHPSETTFIGRRKENISPSVSASNCKQIICGKK